MTDRQALTEFATHDVINQPGPLPEFNWYDIDAPLKEAFETDADSRAVERVRRFGETVGRHDTWQLGEDANRHPPELMTFDRFGRRIDDVRFHPAYHTLMALAMEHGVPSIAWLRGEKHGHLVHVTLEYLLQQVEAGVCCPLTMTYAGLPVLRRAPDIAAEWEPRLTAPVYDMAYAPATEKSGATMGMAMTEKQGGSDVRANTTRATPIGGGEFLLTGHKWFCSAPMSDCFLTLAQAPEGLSCFFVPRWRPDGTRNRIFIQRLKDKLGNRSNASAEIEYDETWGRMIGQPGRGVPTIIEMVHHTRLDCAMAAASLMRQALVQALHFTAHRTAFQRRLIDQPLMRNVLADLAVESEAATRLMLFTARAFDGAAESPPLRVLSRLAVAIAKYWNNKRAAPFIYEALECLGGTGFVEDSPMPRLYREAPLNSIWEGSGNVICLDIMRTLTKEPEAFDLLLDELGKAKGADARLDRAVDALRALARGKVLPEAMLRRVVERCAVTLQAALLVRFAPACVADAFCAAHLDGDCGKAFGTLPGGADIDGILARAAAFMA